MQISVVDDMWVGGGHGLGHLPGVEDADIAGGYCNRVDDSSLVQTDLEVPHYKQTKIEHLIGFMQSECNMKLARNLLYKGSFLLLTCL